MLFVMKRVCRRLTTILTILTILALLRPVFAQDIKENPYWRQSTTSQVQEVEVGPENEVTAPRYTYFQTNTTFNAISAGILDPTGQNQSAAVPLLGRSIALLTGRPPVQTHEYLAYMASKAGFIDQAYAQSRGGFEVLQPIQKLWIATRNIAYLITSLTLVVIGFMIMLRKKIDAQTIVGVEQALPNLVITLLLITFSYAIAGFVIDMIYFVSFFGIKLLALNNIFAPGDYGSAAIETIRTKSIFSIGIRDLFRIGGTSAGSAETAADAVGNLIAELLGEGKLFAATQIISQPIAYVIFAVAILFAVFKLFFSLLMAYIQIILLAILGPLQLMLNALPGSDAFSKWFRNLLANAMAFPAAIMMLVFAAALMGQTGEHFRIADDIGFTDSVSGVKWIPPLVFGSGAGATNPVDAVIALIGIGILLMTPKVVDMVKEAIQAPEFKYGSAIGEAVGFGWSPIKRGWGAGTDIARQERQFREQARIWGKEDLSPYQPPTGQQPTRWTDLRGRLGAFGRRFTGLQ